MNGMVDFVSSFHLFMNNQMSKKEEEPSDKVGSSHDLHNKEKPKYKKKPLTAIFKMNSDEKKKYAKKK